MRREPFIGVNRVESYFAWRWTTCCQCGMEFRFERGWSMLFPLREYVCIECAPTRWRAAGVYHAVTQKRRDRAEIKIPKPFNADCSDCGSCMSNEEQDERLETCELIQAAYREGWTTGYRAARETAPTTKCTKEDKAKLQMKDDKFFFTTRWPPERIKK